jgi:hypothetical protein
MHAHEEDKESELVYRPASYSLPPSRGRSALDLLADGTYVESSPGPTDRPEQAVVEAPRGRHSQKPATVYELIERAWPKATKLELFGRGKPRAGWADWGNEALA